MVEIRWCGEGQGGVIPARRFYALWLVRLLACDGETYVLPHWHHPRAESRATGLGEEEILRPS